MGTLPTNRARCYPAAGCKQSEDCARAVAYRRRNEPGVVDASICLTVFNPNCPMFLPRAGLALLQPVSTEPACHATA